MQNLAESTTVKVSKDTVRKLAALQQKAADTSSQRAVKEQRVSDIGNDQSRIRAEKLRLDNELHANICKDLAITHYGLDQYHSAWKEIKNVETLGFKCDPGFVAKVRKALLDQGVDPEAEDKKAREVQRGTDSDEESKK